MSKSRLGRGLDSLLSEKLSDTRDVSESAPVEETFGSEVGVDEIHPSPFQPRKSFDDEALSELSVSIKEQGLLQPVVVRHRAQGGYELIAGERRWRAARLAGLAHIPAVVKNVGDVEASALALIENMQREDLNAMEEAVGLARLRDEFELTQQEIADAVGKSRTAIANLLRLMQLGSTARGLLEAGDLDMGHARALLGLEGVVQDQTARKVADQELSVRQCEALVKKLAAGGSTQKPSRPAEKDADTLRLEQRMTDSLGAPVAIRHRKNGAGEVTIRYTSLDELQGVVRRLGIEE